MKDTFTVGIGTDGGDVMTRSGVTRDGLRGTVEGMVDVYFALDEAAYHAGRGLDAFTEWVTDHIMSELAGGGTGDGTATACNGLVKVRAEG